MDRKTSAVCQVVLLGVVLLLFDAAVCGANLISYSTWPARRDKLMVIDENGGDPVEVLVMSKYSFPGGGSISPAAPADLEDTWIVFNDLDDIYKIRPDGSNQTLVLCSVGTDAFGAPYVVGSDAVWSPDRSEILLWVGPEDTVTPKGSLAVIPANQTADGSCTSELVRIYSFTSPWGLDVEPAWSHDGSRLAFTETNVETEESHLVVIERQPSGTWERIDPLIFVDPDFSPLGFSWRPQAASGLLIFRQRDDYLVPGVCCWLGSVDLATGEWAYVLDSGNPIQMHVGSRPKWSSNGDEILFTDPDGNLVRWIYPDGERQVIGSGTLADWQRDLVAGVCGDGTCAGSENQCNCPGDCGSYPSDEAGLCTDFVDNDCDGPVDCDDGDCTSDAACLEPFCGDETCDPDETQCSCPDDCGAAPFTESSCTDGLDNDCDTLTDCDDTDCADDPVCSVTCGAVGDSCESGADCCSGLCHPKKGVCK